MIKQELRHLISNFYTSKNNLQKISFHAQRQMDTLRNKITVFTISKLAKFAFQLINKTVIGFSLVSVDKSLKQCWMIQANFSKKSTSKMLQLNFALFPTPTLFFLSLLMGHICSTRKQQGRSWLELSCSCLQLSWLP